jgi:hypothetical protein
MLLGLEPAAALFRDAVSGYELGTQEPHYQCS